MDTIRLHVAQEKDFQSYYSLRCDESDIYWMGHEKPPDYFLLKKCFLERTEEAPFLQEGEKKIYMIMLKGETNPNEIPIGQVLMTIGEDEIELGISIFSAFQGQGYGTCSIKLATKIALLYSDNICAKIRDDNYASQKCFQKCGFLRTDEYEMKDYPKVGRVKLRKYYYASTN